ncbi:MAG TPA: cellulase N-terminal Ig-like domain-containing protein, partial [Flavobacterium sp.]|nr:cellulase N-terminal Ig-like domain-containing protein [Flavobacterium sp.]
MKKITILVSSLLMALSLHAQVSEYIHVDQFGYTINAEKVAVLSDPQEGLNADGAFTPGTTLEIRRVGDDSVAFTGSPAAWNGGATHAQSGDKGWWFDFSTLTEEGDFYVYDVASGAKSAAFTIGENPYYDVMKAASKMF